MDDPATLVERLYDAFNRRDANQISAVCDDGMEFFAAVTAGAIGRAEPYVGPAGLRSYFGDVAEVWEELLITPHEVERRGDHLLVSGRLYGRSRELGIRDVPMAWLWEIRNGRFVRGQVFADPARALERFSAVPTEGLRSPS